MIKKAHVQEVTTHVARAAQQSARHCQNFSAAFKGMISVTVMRRRAMDRLERVQGHAAVLSVNLLNLLRVNQVLSMQMATTSARPHELSHFWLHSSNPHNP